MRRISATPGFEVSVKAPTLGLNTRVPGRKVDPRGATAASNVRFANGVASNATGYGVLVTDPLLPKLPVLFQQVTLDRGGRAATSVVVGTENKLYALFRYPETYTPFTCSAEDPMSGFPDWELLSERAVIAPPVDVYGVLGMEELRSSPSFGAVWQVCDSIQYCDGPIEEGATMTDIDDRYATRWVAKLEDGRMYYRRVATGEDWTPVPDELVPQPNSEMLGIGFCFDANARPCFASQIGHTVHVWRWAAGTPTEYTFQGTGPRLFFGGTLRPDNTSWDVVCYFCWNGELRETIQRENFATEHTLHALVGYPLDRVNVVDRGSGEESERLYVAATGGSSFYGLFRSPRYPLWPTKARDGTTMSAGMLPDGDYSPAVVAVGADDAMTLLAVFLTDGDYQPSTVAVSPSDSATGTASFSSDGSYLLVVIEVSAPSDALSGTVTLASDGDYYETIVSGGSYTDTQTATAALLADGDYTL